MFENTKQPDDMFAGVEVAVPPSAAGTPSPAAAAPAPVESVVSAPRRGFPVKPVLIGFVVVAVVAIAAWIAYAMLSSGSSVTPPAPAAAAPPAVTAPTPTPAPTPAPAEATTPEPVTATTPGVDRDKDGLTDAEEAKLGTSPTSADTDADGLFDKEEVDTYHTDPLNPDTDGDGYLDGAEVKAGYNPLGEGKLFSVPK